MKEFDQFSYKKSLGDLRMVNKTHPKGPDLLGKMKLQGHTLKTLVDQFVEEGDDAVALRCNLAGWFYDKDGDQFLSIELSPFYASKKAAVETKNLSAWLGHGD